MELFTANTEKFGTRFVLKQIFNMFVVDYHTIAVRCARNTTFFLIWNHPSEAIMSKQWLFTSDLHPAVITNMT